jgi:site-specific DNA-methyltransferase (adenine-specific)
MLNSGLFTSLSPNYATPKALYAELDAEFHFNDDPCPFEAEPFFEPTSGLEREWGTSTFCNPPYGRKIGAWIAKGYAESQKGKTIVFLIPSRTDTDWWHRFIMKASEIRFVRGRLSFSDKGPAPFPSAVIVFRTLMPHEAG